MNIARNVSLAFLLSLFAIACSRAEAPLVFVANGVNEVDMLNLVEAPAGHLSGVLVVSTIDQTGDRKDITLDVSGSIYHDNISLQIQNGFVGKVLDELFGSSENLIGKMNNDSLTFMSGNNTEVFYRVPRDKYAEDLAALDQRARNEKQILAANKALDDFGRDERDLDSNLRQFVQWGRAQIDHVSVINDWYMHRVSSYQYCLDKVRPLAIRHDSSWKWDQCVFNMRHDGIAREQMVKSVMSTQSKERDEEQSLNAKIIGMPVRIANVGKLWYSACLLQKDRGICAQQVDKYSETRLNSFGHSESVTEYKLMLPKIRSTVDDGVQISIDGERKLTDLAHKMDKLFDSKNK